mgnify:CR=1 FL=1
MQKGSPLLFSKFQRAIDPQEQILTGSRIARDDPIARDPRTDTLNRDGKDTPDAAIREPLAADGPQNTLLVPDVEDGRSSVDEQNSLLSLRLGLHCGKEVPERGLVEFS